MKTIRVTSIIFALLTTVAVSSSNAALSISFGLDDEFSGGTPPASGTLPWVEALFSESGPGAVEIQVTAPNLVGAENVLQLYFNLNPDLNPNLLSFVVASSSGSFDLPSFSTGVDQFKADGDGQYDVLFDFSSGGNVGTTFTHGDELTLTAMYFGGSITPIDFAYESKPAGGHGPFYAAAHVQNTPNGGGSSGWISADTFVVVPEPGTYAAALFLVGAFFFFNRRHRRADQVV